MKKLKIWSLIMFVVMALPLIVACGDDDDNGNGGGQSTTSAFTIVWDNIIYNYTSDFHGVWENHPKNPNHIRIYLPNNSYFAIEYPRNTKMSSFFEPGYNYFLEDATSIFISSPSSWNTCTYVEGEAVVVRNQDNVMTIVFSNYTFLIENYRKLILNGPLDIIPDIKE